MNNVYGLVALIIGLLLIVACAILTFLLKGLLISKLLPFILVIVLLFGYFSFRKGTKIE